MISEAFADLLFVSGDGVGAGGSVVIAMELIPRTNDNVGEWNVFADVLKDCDGGFVMWHRDNNGFAVA